MVCPPPRRCCVLRRRINRDKRGGSVPLSTYENIIPQRGEIVKRLAAVFKKIFGGFFCLGGSLLSSLITSTEYIKSVTNYYLFILSLYISLILLYLYIIILIYYYIYILLYLYIIIFILSLIVIYTLYL